MKNIEKKKLQLKTYNASTLNEKVIFGTLALRIDIKSI